MSSANSGRGLKELILISLYQPRKTVWSLPSIYGFSPGNLSIIVTPLKRHEVPNHRQFDCFIGYSATRKKCQCSAWQTLYEGNPPWLADSPNKGPVKQKVFPYYDVIVDLRRSKSHAVGVPGAQNGATPAAIA